MSNIRTNEGESAPPIRQYRGHTSIFRVYKNKVLNRKLNQFGYFESKTSAVATFVLIMPKAREQKQVKIHRSPNLSTTVKDSKTKAFYNLSSFILVHGLYS